MNFAPSCRRAASPTRSSPLGAAARLCVRTALGCSEFLLVGRLPSIASSSFGDFSGTTHPSDFSRSFISAFRPWPSLRGSSDSSSTSDREISRFPREKFSLACPALRPRRFLPELAFSLWSAWPSALSPDGVGNRNFGVFSRLNHAACTTPCQRLVLCLAASTHDSGPSWFATPFLVRHLSRFFSPVSRRSRRGRRRSRAEPRPTPRGKLSSSMNPRESEPEITLESLVEQITEENRHDEIEMEPSVGNEVW